MNKKIIRDINKILELPEVQATKEEISMYDMQRKLNEEFSRYPVLNSSVTLNYLNGPALKRIITGSPKYVKMIRTSDANNTSITLFSGDLRNYVDGKNKLEFFLDEEGSLLVSGKDESKKAKKMYTHIKKNHSEYIKEQLEQLNELKKEYGLYYNNGYLNTEAELGKVRYSIDNLKVFGFDNTCLESRIVYNRSMPKTHISISEIEKNRHAVFYEGPELDEVLDKHKTDILKRSIVTIGSLQPGFQKILTK